mmetsp:Transcript_85863/g.278110  ORF Transcript_85863/g.278110 Transcript_85863/m.278110 type:complete len:230 (+) Transcript_85863:699-1388(+)
MGAPFRAGTPHNLEDDITPSALHGLHKDVFHGGKCVLGAISVPCTGMKPRANVADGHSSALLGALPACCGVAPLLQVPEELVPRGKGGAAMAARVERGCAGRASAGLGASLPRFTRNLEVSAGWPKATAFISRQFWESSALGGRQRSAQRTWPPCHKGIARGLQNAHSAPPADCSRPACGPPARQQQTHGSHAASLATQGSGVSREPGARQQRVSPLVQVIRRQVRRPH